jgi:hypothetical protein
MKEHLFSVLSCKIWSDIGAAAKEGKTGQGRGQSLLEGEWTYLVGEVTHA